MENDEKLFEDIKKCKFYIGNQNILDPLYGKLEALNKAEEHAKEWNKFLKETKVQISTLLKTDNLSFLFGTGPSIPYGAVSVRNIPLELEYGLCQIFIKDKKVLDELKLFYKSIAFLLKESPLTEEKIVKRYEELKKWCKNKAKIYDILEIQSKKGMKVNLEALLDVLYRWLSSGLHMSELNNDGIFNQIDMLNSRSISVDDGKGNKININLSVLSSLIKEVKAIFISLCILPRKDRAISEDYSAHRNFLRKVLKRPLNLKRTKIFTINYDTLFEKAMDARGIFYFDGFIGREHRFFRPECYGYDLYFPAGTTEGRVHRLDKVIHLYKLHGSINWRRRKEDFDNIYGLEMVPSDNEIKKEDAERVIIYPTPRKYGETLGFPYSELLRHFATSIVQPQSVLFVLGYSFGDSHINNIIRQALTIPSFTMIIVDPCDPDKNVYIKSLVQMNDSRIYVFSGNLLGCFENFVSNVMPDLQEIKISEKVFETYRAIGLIKNDLEIKGKENDK